MDTRSAMASSVRSLMARENSRSARYPVCHLKGLAATLTWPTFGTGSEAMGGRRMSSMTSAVQHKSLRCRAPKQSSPAPAPSPDSSAGMSETACACQMRDHPPIWSSATSCAMVE
eukprot:84101-Pyramimonas_sp.AAC.1